MRVLDGVIGNRNLYREAREKRIAEIKLERSRMRSDREVYEKNKSLIEAYESFVCDSAKAYIRENLVIARRLHDTVLISECAIRLALVYSMSGQFVQADKLFFPCRLQRVARLPESPLWMGEGEISRQHGHKHR